MKKLLTTACLFVVTTLAIVSFIASQVYAQQTNIQTTLRVPQLKADFMLFRGALEEAHPGLYRYTPKDEMDAEFERVAAKLRRPMTVLEFHNVLARVLVAIKCEHTYIASAEVNALLDSSKLFPLKLTFQSERAFVLLNVGLDERVKPGMEVLAINGQHMDAIVKRLLPYLPHDGDIRTAQIFRLSQARLTPVTREPVGFSTFYRLHIGDPKSFRAKLRDSATGKTMEVELLGVTNEEAVGNVYKNVVNRNVLAGISKIAPTGRAPSTQYLNSESAAMLRVPSFGMDENEFRGFLDTCFARLKSDGTKYLIIDVRANRGGRDGNGALLFSYLTPKEFGLFKRIHMKTYEPSFKQYTDFKWNVPPGFVKPDPNGGWLLTEKKVGVSVQKPSEPHFDGAVYVLIDGGSFSGTADFAALADFDNRATFIGQETGGAAEGNNSGPEFRLTLPESKLRIGIPAYAYFNYVKPGNRRRGTLPKHAVTQTIDDLAKGRDTVVEFTRELIRRGKAH